MYLFQSVIENIMHKFPSYRRKKEKRYIRSVLAQKRRTLSKEEVEICSAEVVAQIADSRVFKEAQTVMLYYPVHNEIDLRGLIQLAPNKHYLLPVTHRKSIEVREYTSEENMRKGKLGIPEPQSPTYKGKIDLIIIPGVGFDKKLVRLGRGGGYYDRFLTGFRNSTKMGVAYRCQLVDNIPSDRHDQKMDIVISSKTK